MRRAAAVIIAALMMASGILAAPVTKPASPPARPASQPTTEPARVDPKFVADFNEHLLGAKFDDVVAKLREIGALAEEPVKVSEGGQGKNRRVNYRVSLGYAWEFSAYGLTLDDAGKICKFQFGAWLDGAGGTRGWPQEAGVLKPGNKWYLTHLWPQFVSAPGFYGGRVSFLRVQAASPAEAAAQMVEACRKADERVTKSLAKMGSTKPNPLPVVKAADVEVHEWFMPRLVSAIGERTD